MPLNTPSLHNLASLVLPKQVEAEQVRAHYAQIPAMAIAPTLGGLFTVWVLWGAVDNRVLVVGILAVALLSALRMLVYQRFFAADAARAGDQVWRLLAVAAAALSGCIWGSAAPLLYPPQQPGYEVYLLVLLTLLPIVPVAALAVYMPAFYAYYLPCMAPFILTLALQPSRPEKMAALLPVMMMAAMLTFARRYSRSLTDAIGLRLQLAQKSEALELAIRHKSQFIAAASHDLRQPVHAMSLFLAARPQDKDAQDASFMGFLEASLRNLREMLTNLLDSARLEAGVVRVARQRFELGPLLQKLADEHAPLAQQAGLGFRCRTVDSPVQSDPILLERILRNLLGNALKYTPQGHVALVARRTGSTVTLQVHDTGIGVAASQASRIFEEFIRVDDGWRSDAGGLGLGLAISRRLAALLGQPIRLRSVPGRGSVFSIEVPLAEGCQTTPPAGPHTPSAASMRAGLVLVIDDDARVGVGTCALMRRWGHHAHSFVSVNEAMEMLVRSATQPDLLIADVHLGLDASGLDAVTRIHQHLGHTVPVILVTGDTDPRQVREAFAAGHVLLHKPLDPQRLRACMTDILGAAPALVIHQKPSAMPPARPG